MRPAVQLAPGVVRLAEHATEPQLAGQLRVGGVGDVVLADVAVQPVREVEEAVVHREDEVGDQARHRERPALELDALDRDHRVGRPGAVVAVEAPHRRSRAPRRRSPARRRGRGASAPRAGRGPVSPRSIVCSSVRSSRSQKWMRLPVAAGGDVVEVEALLVGVRLAPLADETSTFLRGWYQKS